MPEGFRINVNDAGVMQMLARARLRQDEALRKSLVELGDQVAVHLQEAAPRSSEHRGSGKPLAESFKTRSRRNSVVVASYKPYAAIMEAGGTTPPHDITPKKALALAFGGTVTKIVHHPGGKYQGKHFAARVAAEDGSLIEEGVAAAVMRTFD